MKPIVIDGLTYEPDPAALCRRLHLDVAGPQAAELADLVAQAQRIGRPKALCGLAFIDERGEDYVIADGIRFTSRVLAVNLGQAHRLFPYVATCGAELQSWADGLDDVILSFWSEAIREQALGQAIKALESALEERFQPGHLAGMNPGSLTDWPIREQRPLFRLLGDPEGLIGVRLTPSLLMVPTKSVSGIRFPTETSFVSCQLCPREVCPNRRAPYDPELYDARYRRS